MNPSGQRQLHTTARGLVCKTWAGFQLHAQPLRGMQGNLTSGRRVFLEGDLNLACEREESTTEVPMRKKEDGQSKPGKKDKMEDLSEKAPGD